MDIELNAMPSALLLHGTMPSKALAALQSQQLWTFVFVANMEKPSWCFVVNWRHGDMGACVLGRRRGKVVLKGVWHTDGEDSRCVDDAHQRI